MKGRYSQNIVFVDAYQLTRDVENDYPAWLEEKMKDGKVSIVRASEDKARIYGCAVRTPEGKMRSRIGDYIVMEPDGSLRVLKKSHFESLYLPVTFDEPQEGDAG